MSNTQVGPIYQQIILDVIEASRVDLEENGVDESILEELKQGWQKKLSQQQLASFPWDPKPDPPAPAPASAPAPQPASVGVAVSAPDVGVSNGMAAQRVTQPGAPAFSPTQPQPMVKTEPGVKIEPGLDPNTQMPHISNPNVQARVINNLQHTYGARADATISKLQESMGPGANGAQYSAPQRPGQPGPQQAHPQYQANTLQQQQYRQQLAAGQGQPRVPPQPQAGQNGQKPGPSQFDGAEDGFSGVLMHQNSAGETTELGRVEIDRMLHEQILARAKSMEGGGLMLPLKRTANKPSAISYHRGQPNSGPGRFDGGDDDLKSDDDDEAINSELDDSDDNLDEDDEDEDGGQIMLCMYDKVQRVKNKWKCVLKDGVLSVNGKDYVFHKASGEYEW